MDVLIASHSGPSWSDQDDHVVASALQRHGLDVATVAWDDPSVDWGAARLALIRSTWDYVDRLDDYLAWAERVDGVTELHNSAEVVRWNTRKDYLLTLEERGTPIVPTAWLGQGDHVDLATLLDERGWSDAIVKPLVGAGATGLVRVADVGPAQAQRHLDGLLAVGDAMVQPFQSRVLTDGELSVVLFDGEVSHAVRKVPAEGDLRVQLEFGGRYIRDEDDTEALDLARWIVQTTGHDLLYARVDLIADEDGAWQLGELEATEPSLYLTFVPDGADRLAAAVQRRLSDAGTRPVQASHPNLD